MIKIELASPDVIRSWSHGEVTKPETIFLDPQKTTNVLVDVTKKLKTKGKSVNVVVWKSLKQSFVVKEWDTSN
jgi:DNA-directed RNA polymerase beta' subunit